MFTIPLRLISSEEKVKYIDENYCGKCRLNRRTDLEQILTPGQELDANIWNSRDIFGLSVNIDMCLSKKEQIESYPDDVNIIPINIKDVEFVSDSQLDDINFEEVKSEKIDSQIIYLIINELQSIKGTFPFKGGTPDEELYNFRIRVDYRPMVLNVFHFQVEVLSDQNGEWKKIERSNSKKCIRSLASKIRNKIISERMVQPLV